MTQNQFSTSLQCPRREPLEEETRSSKVLQIERTADNCKPGSRDITKGMCRSVEYNGDSCVVTVDKQSEKSTRKGKEPEKDIFLGVTYRKTARFYLSGIDKESTSLGIQNYIQNKGIKITHFILFKPKTRSRFLSAKLNVPAHHADLIEDANFWPEGVRCRRWLSEHQWEERCAVSAEDDDTGLATNVRRH